MGLKLVRLSLLFAMLAGSARFSVAAATDEAQHLFELVEAEPPKGKSRLSIQQELFKAAPPATADFRVRLAYGYALAHEKKYTDALAVVAAVSGEKPDNIAAHRTRAWLLLATQKPAEALAELDAIARVFATPAASSQAEKERVEAAEFLGTALAYCEGPAASLLDKAAVKQTKGNVLKALSTPQRAAFFQQATKVAKLAAELKAVAEVDQDKKGEADQAAAAKLAEIEKAAAAKKAEDDKVAAELRKQYNQLTAEYARFNTAHAQLNNERAAAQTGLAKLQSRLSLAKAPPKGGKGPTASNQQATGQLNDAVDAMTANIAKVDAAIAESTAKGKAIEDQIARIRLDGQQVGANFEELDKTVGLKKPKQPRQKNKAKPAKPAAPKPAPAIDPDKDFVTYDAFPYQVAKERLLESLSAE